MKDKTFREEILNNVADVKEGAPIGNRNAAKDGSSGGATKGKSKGIVHDGVDLGSKSTKELYDMAAEGAQGARSGFRNGNKLMKAVEQEFKRREGK